MSGSSSGTDEPTHAGVAAAVGRTDDPELADWVAAAEDYVLLPVELPGVHDHDLFALQPVDAGHPIAVCLARHRESGRVTVTSARPAVVSEVLRREAGPPSPQAVVGLLARTWSGVEYVGPADVEDPVQAVDDGWQADVVVRSSDTDQLERWIVRLSEHQPGWEVRDWAGTEPQ